MWAVLSGLRRFPVFCGLTNEASKETFKMWLEEFAENELLHEYYPELIVFAETVNPLRLEKLYWSDTGEKIGAYVDKGAHKIVLPDCLGVLGTISINSPGRGMRQKLKNGKVERPDLALLDDPQNSEMAASPAQVKKTVRVIEKDIMFLSGRKKRMAALMACTVILPDDVASYFLDHDEWQAVRAAMITVWPGDWHEKKSKTKALWNQWNEIRKENASDKQNRACKHFYKENQKELTKGFELCWKYGFEKGKEPDAFFHTMVDFYHMGEEGFASELQNEPLKHDATIFDLDSKTILSKTDNARERYEVPPWAKVLVSATDINHYGLHTVTMAFGMDHTAAIVDYRRFDRGGKGIVQKNANANEKTTSIFNALCDHGKELAGLKFVRKGKLIVPQMWVIDGGYEHETVQQFVGSSGRQIGLNCQVIRGFSADRYNPAGKGRIGQPLERCHPAESVMGRWLAADVDYWRENFQRGFLGAFGTPGGCTIFAGKHTEFSNHVLAERLTDKVKAKDGSFIYKWNTKPGWHDWLDAGVYCCVAAVFGGIGTTPLKVQSKKRVQQVRKSKVARR
jgi:hypothetical protein